MKRNYAINVKNLVIEYKSMKSFAIKQSLLKFKRSKKESFVALKGVSFSVEKGKIVGIVGRNGSGKSTLLRAIAGVFSPDKGEIKTYNNSISLLALGVGFQSNLTGFENIYLSGLLLGFTEQEVKSKIKEIIEFSELGNFIYKPVRTYSSGMHSKLAFSITAILEADIILIDEVLSVGDINFKEKSYNKMKELILDETKTVVIVSHSLQTIDDLCDSAIWLEQGKIIEYGIAKDVTRNYARFMRELRENNNMVIK